MLRSQFARYDVHPDGSRFLVVRNRGDQEPVRDELVVVVNWVREMEERMRSSGTG